MTETPTLDSKIVEEMTRIANMQDVYQRYKATDDPDEQGNLDDEAVGVIFSGRDPQADPNYKRDLDELEDQFYSSVKDSLKTIKINTQLSVAGLKEDYASNQDLIYKTVEDKLNEALADAENKGDAVDKIMYALGPTLRALIKVDVTQEDADNVYHADFTRRTNVIPRRTKNGVGSIEEATNSQYRVIASGYIVEETDKKGITTYTIDTEKLKKLIDNPVTGSILYSAKPEQQRQAA
ncbi:MAG: hypothetical protein CMH62_00745 [Nanoarchaeota archaeon]|nr:hypothetical protein [Nanoarchaeota archaeon]|tara:strand:- start:837 stop:1547 length:711 start_codon:yes stop_codon:yes gene_type:complete